jgi:glucokinase
MFLGVEIGGTKLQLGVGPGDGKLRGLWRGVVDPREGSTGIQRQILSALPGLYRAAGIQEGQLRGVGVGFGGPIDDETQTVITSHQIAGWDGFPLADWLNETVGGLPVALGNDADVAGLAEALYGAGKGHSPVFYVTVGTGIGGGLVIDGEIYRGVGRGAAEVGHLTVLPGYDTHEAVHPEALEDVASGSGIARRALVEIHDFGKRSILAAIPRGELTAAHVAEAARQGDALAERVIDEALEALAEALDAVVLLLCPRRIVIGGGVSLMGEEQFFAPLRRLVTQRVFRPFAGLTQIVPAALGEEVVVHGAIALIRQRLERMEEEA